MEENIKESSALKISVLCASRGNHHGLHTTLSSLDALASGGNKITYVVACDFDDVLTQNEIGLMCNSGLPVMMTCAKRRESLGAAWNGASLQEEYDVCALVTDRSVVVTPFWDVYISDAFGKDDSRIVWWTTNNGPVIPIVPKRWIEAAGGKIFTEYFPFWFDDTWLHELSALTHGLPNFMVQASCFINKKSPVTKRMRDLRFWMDFFIAKRPERIEHAKNIRAVLGLKEPDMKPLEEWFKQNDAMWEEHWKKWEGIMQDLSEPDESYLRAKKAADEYSEI